jgi:hypothetical protein
MRKKRKKKTAPQLQRHPKASSPQQTGLIVRAKTATPSAGTTSPLDHRSHRTNRA